MTRSKGNHQCQPEAKDPIKQSNMVLCPDVPKVHQDDAQPVERVKNDCGDESYFCYTHQGCLVRPNDRVVSLGADPDECGIKNVDE